MLSFRQLYVPQCWVCGEAAPGPDGEPFFVPTVLLPQDTRDALTSGGWDVSAGTAPHDLLLSDKLKCPGCVAKQQEEVRALQEALHREPVKEIDMSTKLGKGWTLRQREGDAERQRWLVAYQGKVRGAVYRYQRRSGEWSRGWVAETNGGTGMLHMTAVKEGCLHEKSSFLWRSRDLAAWGIAKRPKFYDPKPDWARRKKA